MVQIAYDAAVDVLSIILVSKRVKESAEILPDVIVDFDDDGRVVAFEILAASKIIDTATFETAGAKQHPRG